jgi:hypothetical protein
LTEIVAVGAGVVVAVVAWAFSQQPAACPSCECAIRLRTMRKRQVRCQICKVQMVVAPGWWRQRITDWWVDKPPYRSDKEQRPHRRHHY